MKKGKLLFWVLLLICFLIVSLLVVYLVVNHLATQYQAMVAERHHLLCDVLRPGMSEEEVINTLHQTGKFTMSRAEWSGGRVELGIKFTDSNSQKIYGTFDLGFLNDQYKSAYIRYGSDNFVSICDFGTPTP